MPLGQLAFMDQRTAAGQAFIDALVASADAKINSGASADGGAAAHNGGASAAIALYRRAGTVAAQIKSESAAELKAKGDYQGLAKLPRDASPVRVVNRCKISGRRHAHLRKFGVSRLTFREMALNGLIPGVTKASW